MGLGLWRLYSERKHAEALLMVDSEDLAGNGRALGWAATELYINLCKTLGQTDSARKTKDTHTKQKRSLPPIPVPHGCSIDFNSREQKEKRRKHRNAFEMTL